MVQFRIVVAKYKEDISWCKSYTTTIYNKGDDYVENAIPLPNIGREAHTYLYHIVENYDNLDEYTVFLQGNPSDHSRDLHKKLNDISESIDVPDYIDLCHQLIHATTRICHYDPTLPLSEFDRILFGEMPEREIIFGAGAQFCVSKRAILSVPKSTWKYLLETIHENRGAWVIERFWREIFLSGLGSAPPLKQL